LAHRIFISRHTNSDFEEREFVRIRHLVEAHGFWPVYDNDLSGPDAKAVIRKRVSSCAGLIAICTPDPESRSNLPHEWVQFELQTAFETSESVLPVLYKGVQLPPALIDPIYVIHDPNNECATYLRIGNILGRWRTELGADKPVLLTFDDTKDFPRSFNTIQKLSRVQVTLTKGVDGERTQECKLQIVPAGFQILVRGVQEGDQVQVHLSLHEKRWSSRLIATEHLEMKMEFES
jgi:hypothetical protein